MTSLLNFLAQNEMSLIFFFTNFKLKNANLLISNLTQLTLSLRLFTIGFFKYLHIVLFAFLHYYYSIKNVCKNGINKCKYCLSLIKLFMVLYLINLIFSDQT